MFPDLPHPGYSWRLNHHMGIVTPAHLYHILWAANEFSRNADPPADINNYLIANAQLTPNVREDSGQPDAWRDYQQILSELGLIFSLEVTPQITLTPLGLALLDGSVGFSEIMTLQALRFQYPNGHHLQMSPAQRAELQDTQYVTVRSFAELLCTSGVQIRPAVLAWRVLRTLSTRNSAAEISVGEFESYLMRCATNAEFAACADAIIRARTTGVTLPQLGQRQRRNSQDWFKFLRLTTIFTATDDRQPVLSISNFGNQHADDIDEICTALESPATFWEPETFTHLDRLRWYSEFGGVDLSVPQLPKTEAEAEAAKEEFVAGEEQEDEHVPEDMPKGGTIELRAFSGIAQENKQLPNLDDLTIQSVYSAALTHTAHRLHDQMIC